MNTSLQNKHALVCGASSGIGRAVAKELAEAGATIILLARRENLLEELIEELPTKQDHQFVVCDLSMHAQVQETLTSLVTTTKVDIVVNNAGGPPAGPIVEAEPEVFETAFRTHVLSSHLIMQHVLPGMQKEKFGRFINIISTSVKAPIPNLGVSNTIRGAMANWAKTLASEVAKDGITVNNVLPGFTDTKRLMELREASAQRLDLSTDQMQDKWLSTIPAKRLGTPEEIAQAVAFLASPAASYINGINLPVDGGRTPSL